MQVQTDRFGPIEVDEAATFDVVGGIPGFAHLRRVALLGAGAVPGHPPVEDQHTMFWLQDLDDASLAFLCIQPWVPFPEYDVELDVAPLGIEDEDDVCVLALVSVQRGDGAVTMSANLRAPLVLDTAHRRLHQVILPDLSLPVRAPFATSRPDVGTAGPAGTAATASIEEVAR